MKALIRNAGETITEGMMIEGIDWNTGAPLTNAAWCGGPYVLVTNYVAPKSDSEPETYEIVEPVQEPETVESSIPDGVEIDLNEIVIIDGKTYTKAQLREMLGE